MEDRNDSSELPELEWLEEFQIMADEQLNEGSACAQVHPIVEKWLEELLEGEPPEARDAVWQAMACLTTEVLIKATPEHVLDVLEAHFNEEEIAAWLEGVLLIGRAFQIALDSGRLDDL